MNTQHDITVSGKPLNPPKPPAICPDCRELEKDW